MDVDYSRLLGSAELVVDSENKPPVKEKDKCLTLCLLGNFDFFCRLLIFFKIIFFKTNRNTIIVPISSDPDQAVNIVRPDLGPNCMQRFSADSTSRRRVKLKYVEVGDKAGTCQFRSIKSSY